MEDILIESGRHQPKVEMIANKGIVSFEGRLVLPDSVAFFQPILEWLSQYNRSSMDNLKLVLKLDYFNTSASKQLISMLHLVKEMKDNGKTVEVEWYYSPMEDDVLELIRETEDVVEFRFNKIPM